MALASGFYGFSFVQYYWWITSQLGLQFPDGEALYIGSWRLESSKTS